MKKVLSAISILLILLMLLPGCNISSDEMLIDEETAISIAQEKLEEEQARGFLKNHRFVYARYLSEKNIWMVNFNIPTEPAPGTVILSHYHVILVSAASGEIIYSGPEDLIPN